MVKVVSTVPALLATINPQGPEYLTLGTWNLISPAPVAGSMTHDFMGHTTLLGSPSFSYSMDTFPFLALKNLPGIVISSPGEP